MDIIRWGLATSLGIFVSAVCFSAEPTGEASIGKESEIVATLFKMQLDWAHAVEQNDVDGITRFLHADFTFTSPVGQISGRDEHLAGFRNGDARFPLVALSEVTVRVYGTKAVVTSRPTINGFTKSSGATVTLKDQAARWTDSLVLENGPGPA